MVAPVFAVTREAGPKMQNQRLFNSFTRCMHIFRAGRNFALVMWFQPKRRTRMNTANLQLEGLYSALAALTNVLKDKGLLTREEIDACLTAAEESTIADRPHELSKANIDAIRFPFRYLRETNEAGNPPPSFAAVATKIGLTKDS
jgi:hypothetical protein